MAVTSAHLTAASVLLVEAAGLGFGSAAQLNSPQGCNHLRQHLLITEGCLDYHTMFNGKLPYDEYHQHKEQYIFCVPPQSTVLLISPHQVPPPPYSQTQYTVKIALGKCGKSEKQKHKSQITQMQI